MPEGDILTAIGHDKVFVKHNLSHISIRTNVCSVEVGTNDAVFQRDGKLAAR